MDYMDNKFSNIKERILHYAEYKGIAKELFFKNIGMTYGSFKGSAKQRPLNSDAIENVLSTYPELNSRWLLTGEGQMLKVSRSFLEKVLPVEIMNTLNNNKPEMESNQLLENILSELEYLKEECREKNRQISKLMEANYELMLRSNDTHEIKKKEVI